MVGASAKPDNWIIRAWMLLAALYPSATSAAGPELVKGYLIVGIECPTATSAQLVVSSADSEGKLVKLIRGSEPSGDIYVDMQTSSRADASLESKGIAHSTDVDPKKVEYFQGVYWKVESIDRHVCGAQDKRDDYLKFIKENRAMLGLK